MNIIYNLDTKEIFNIINKKAKYQKVMVVYDDYTSNTDINNIYEEIREICIFNKSHVLNINNEINDGYKLIIYYLSTEAFFKLNFDRTDFVNIYIPTDGFVLPYYVSSGDSDYLITQQNIVDTMAISSIYFNRFYNYLNDLFLKQNSEADFSFLDQITQKHQFIELERYKDQDYIDLDILKKGEFSYIDLSRLDLYLLDAFLTIMQSVRSNTLSMVDTYKFGKLDYEYVDKFYSMMISEPLKHLIELNYNSLYSACQKTKEYILNLLSFDSVNNINFRSDIEKIKNYAKNTNNLIAYLYFYDVFAV